MGKTTLVNYDAVLRRVWVDGQRLHRGATGAAVTVAGLAAVAAQRTPMRSCLPYAVLGTALMAHDWHDRTRWFERGSQFD